jgi:LDH2 family malate/lactate/ureidoglycolate dehydrogenase
METPTIARLDGDRDSGQVVARHGITLAIAKRPGRRASRPCTLRRTNHVGRLADYAEMAAVRG